MEGMRWDLEQACILRNEEEMEFRFLDIFDLVGPFGYS
jgi:hypothetical protein